MSKDLAPIQINAKKIDLNMSGQSPAKYSNTADSPGTGKLQYKGQQWTEVMEGKKQIDDQIASLDEKLNMVLAKQEYEYLKSYNIYVKRKEFELRELIFKLNEKNSDNTAKDQQINNLEKTIRSLRDDQNRMEKEKDDQAKKIKKWQSRSNNFEQERDFLHQQVLESKRQNKLLKLAIGRLQNQLHQPPPAIKGPDEKDKIKQMMNQEDDHNVGETFLTDTKQPLDAMGGTEQKTKIQTGLNISQIGESKEDTAAHTSYIGAHQSYLTSGTAPGLMFANSMMQSKNTGRAQTRSPTSRYKQIPTENLKFQRFIDLIYQSKMDSGDIKEEVLKYVQLLETNYNQTIQDLRIMVDKERIKNKKASFEKVNEISQKNELECLFVECIEEIRKSIMKRRLKSEIMNKKKYQQIEKNTEEAREFEQSLLKLAELAKNRVKITDFTNKDKSNLLELFVNNEKTLLRIYEILFPHRAGPNQGQGVSQSMVVDNGGGVYGNNAIRALSRGNAGSQFDSSFANRQLQSQNAHILNSIGQNNVDYNQAMLNHGGFLPNNYIQQQFNQENKNYGEYLPNIMSANKNQNQMQMSNSKTQLNTSYQLENGPMVGNPVQVRTMTSESYKRPHHQQKNTAQFQDDVMENSKTAAGISQPYPGVQASHLGVIQHEQKTGIAMIKQK